MRSTLSIAAALVIVLGHLVSGQQPAAPVFRNNVNLVLVDADVRDRAGRPLAGLKQGDFEILEDGKAQQIITFSYEEITNNARPVAAAPMLSTAMTSQPAVQMQAVDAANGPLSTMDVAGHRIWVLLFDTSSMQPEDVQKATDAAMQWTKSGMTPADLVAVASIGSRLQVLTDFTTDRDKVLRALTTFGAAEGIAADAVDASTMTTDEVNNAATGSDSAAVDASSQELDTFNNDVRLRGLKTVCDSLRVWQQKKAMLYFSSGMQRSGADNQVEMRAAINACVRANVSLNSVDARGLVAVVPGGSGREGSRGGVGAFSGRNVADQFAQLASQQDTLHTLAADTGGTAFTDSNDFAGAFKKVQQELSSYYVLGYASSNTAQDGRYRRIEVRLKPKMDARIRAREGYYAERDFSHTSRGDRETILQEQLMMAIPATDVPLFVTTGYFRLPAGQGCAGGGPPRGPRPGPLACYYVPISLAVPGDAVPASSEAVTLDVRGFVRDERGQPFATIKDTLTVPPSGATSLSARQVQYQTGTTLPPGFYRAKLVVRENTTGKMGTFEVPITVPDLARSPIKVSSVVLSTQLQRAAGGKTISPLVRGEVEIVPNLTHVVSQDQKLYFYYEVYDPAKTGAATDLRTGLAFYRGKVKVFETPVVQRAAVDAADRNAALFQFELPAGQFKPGLYTCQVNIVDDVAGTFAFPRLDLYVRPANATSPE